MASKSSRRPLAPLTISQTNSQTNSSPITSPGMGKSIRMVESLSSIRYAGAISLDPTPIDEQENTDPASADVYSKSPFPFHPAHILRPVKSASRLNVETDKTSKRRNGRRTRRTQSPVTTPDTPNSVAEALAFYDALASRSEESVRLDRDLECRRGKSASRQEDGSVDDVFPTDTDGLATIQTLRMVSSHASLPHDVPSSPNVVVHAVSHSSLASAYRVWGLGSKSSMGTLRQRTSFGTLAETESVDGCSSPNFVVLGPSSPPVDTPLSAFNGWNMEQLKPVPESRPTSLGGRPTSYSNRPASHSDRPAPHSDRPTTSQSYRPSSSVSDPGSIRPSTGVSEAPSSNSRFTMSDMSVVSVAVPMPIFYHRSIAVSASLPVLSIRPRRASTSSIRSVGSFTATIPDWARRYYSQGTIPALTHLPSTCTLNRLFNDAKDGKDDGQDSVMGDQSGLTAGIGIAALGLTGFSRSILSPRRIGGVSNLRAAAGLEPIPSAPSSVTSASIVELSDDESVMSLPVIVTVPPRTVPTSRRQSRFSIPSSPHLYPSTNRTSRRLSLWDPPSIERLGWKAEQRPSSTMSTLAYPYAWARRGSNVGTVQSVVGVDVDREESVYSDVETDTRVDRSIRKSLTIQLVLFTVGFIIPIAWFTAGLLRLPSIDQDERCDCGCEIDIPPEVATPKSRWATWLSHLSTPSVKPSETVNTYCHSTTRVLTKARWWRMVNRCMSVVGVLIICAVVALAVAGRDI